MNHDTPVARVLRIARDGAWTLFALWTVQVAVVWFCGWTAQDAVKVTGDPGLHAALGAWLRQVDFVWLLFGGVCGYLGLAMAEGLGQARRWMLMLLGTALIVGWALHSMGWQDHQARLGPQLGPVGMGWVALWVALVPSAREAAIAAFPRWGHTQIALATGLLVLIAGFLIENGVTNSRLWWRWGGQDAAGPVSAPAAAYVLWWMMGTGLTWVMRDERAVSPDRRVRGLWALYFCIVGVFLLHAGARLLPSRAPEANAPTLQTTPGR